MWKYIKKQSKNSLISSFITLFYNTQFSKMSFGFITGGGAGRRGSRPLFQSHLDFFPFTPVRGTSGLPTFASWRRVGCEFRGRYLPAAGLPGAARWWPPETAARAAPGPLGPPRPAWSPTVPAEGRAPRPAGGGGGARAPALRRRAPALAGCSPAPAPPCRPPCGSLGKRRSDAGTRPGRGEV